MPIDYDAAHGLLERGFTEVEEDMLRRAEPHAPEDLAEKIETVFHSNTQAYREALLGCAIARYQDRTINIRLPYIKHGVGSYNGRTLDERVVNPFFQRHRIPCSRAPFLSTFRRGIRFNEETKKGIRDLEGYDAFLDILCYLEKTEDDQALVAFLKYLLFRFAQLREASIIRLTRLQRISLEQYGALISGLLATPSGGRFPMLLVVAAFQTVRDFFGTNWQVDFQGINVADAAAGAGGDVTISSGGNILLAAEITERPLESHRVIATFNTKIAPQGIRDYLFFAPLGLPDNVLALARQYFAQGHEMNFLAVRDWIVMLLSTMGSAGRSIFNQRFMELLDGQDIPRSLKVAWNDQVGRLLEPATQN